MRCYHDPFMLNAICGQCGEQIELGMYLYSEWVCNDCFTLDLHKTYLSAMYRIECGDQFDWIPGGNK